MHSHLGLAVRLFSAAALAASIFACSAHDQGATPGANRVGQAAAPLTASATDDPSGMFAAGGTYWFVIDESKPVIDRVKAGCAHDASSDAAAADCVEGIRQEGAREGFRISGNNPAQLTWTSFGMKDGHEEVFLEIPVAVTAAEGTVVHVRATGPARGSQLPAGHHGPDTLAFDVVDAHTMAMIDPEKGRLVYRERL